MNSIFTLPPITLLVSVGKPDELSQFRRLSTPGSETTIIGADFQTASMLRESGVCCKTLEEHFGIPEFTSGKHNLCHPRVTDAISINREDEDGLRLLVSSPIDAVIVNFAEHSTVHRAGSLDEARCRLLYLSRTYYKTVANVVRPQDYGRVVSGFHDNGCLSSHMKETLAETACQMLFDVQRSGDDSIPRWLLSKTCR
ncbi:MAG: hypothetical protein WCO09_00140 [bacterium]